MGTVATLEYDGYPVRYVEKAQGEYWFIVADICRCINMAINSRTGKPNVTVATRELSDSQKEKYRVDTPENPKNPWIDMMIVSESGLFQMLSVTDNINAQRMKQFLEQYLATPQANYEAGYAEAGQTID